MGVVHFMSVGTSPGAVTSALSYLNHNKHNKRDLKSHYDPDKNGDIIESLVIFCSHEVYRGDRRSDEYIWNQYASRHPKRGWNTPSSWPNVIEIIRDFIEKEELLSEKGLLYVVPMDVNNYEMCFEAIAKATLALARPDSTGKWLWANLTGGTNVLNAALMQVAALSGLIGPMYYTFIAQDADRQYLCPPSSNKDQYRLVWLPLIKTTFDEGYYRVLDILEDDNWYSAGEILSRLKDKGLFQNMQESFFVQQYLNRMVGDVLEEKGKGKRTSNRQDRISDRGHKVLEALYADELVEALVHRERTDVDVVQTYRDELEEYRLDRD